MRMNISAWAIRNPVPSLVLFMVLMTLGVTTFQSMPVKRFPNVDIPVVQVQITQPGASPAELETQVTKKIENAVAGITGVKHLLSNVVEGASTTTLEFELGIPIDRATNDVKDAVDRLRSVAFRRDQTMRDIVGPAEMDRVTIATLAESAPTAERYMLIELQADYVRLAHQIAQVSAENRRLADLSLGPTAELLKQFAGMPTGTMYDGGGSTTTSRPDPVRIDEVI